jgi:hypothetical protein
VSQETQFIEKAKGLQNNPASSIAQGSLGGAIVGLVMLIASAISYKSTLGYVPYAHLFIMPGLPLAVGFGALMGGFVAVVIWLLSTVRRRAFGIAGRAIIGFMTALAVIGSYAYLQTETPGLYHEPLSWSGQVVYWLMNGAIGVLPGVMSRQKIHVDSG